MSPAFAALVLLAFWIFMLASLWNKSLTCDEIAHATAGYTYWKFNDYRLQPENGNLPQRVIGIPLALSNLKFPALDTPLWQNSDEWGLGDEWFHQMGNPLEWMLMSGRAANGFLAVLLGILIWFWSRRLFGPWGGVISLALFVVNPTILANGALMTSDIACCLFFLGSTGALWITLQRITIPRILGSGLILGGLFVSKMSASLIIPIWLLLMVARLLAGSPLEVKLGGSFFLTGFRQAAALLAVAIIQLCLVGITIWGFYGFRYSAFSDAGSGRGQFPLQWEFVLGKPAPISAIRLVNLSPVQQERASRIFSEHQVKEDRWTQGAVEAIDSIREVVLTPDQKQSLDRIFSVSDLPLIARILEYSRKHRLLPEAYIYGQAQAWRFSQERGAFLNGEVSMTGWRLFFPYAFAVKTPIPLLVIVLLTLGVGVAKGRKSARKCAAFWKALYKVLPLVILIGVYWCAAILGNLNIGHRHLMVTYAPLFILCGASAYWLESRNRIGTGVLGVMIALSVAETIYRFPNYISYFNGLVRPSEGYRHLVDSSLDWGQDLPAVKEYLRSHADGSKAFLSYFGTASPDYYEIPARPLLSVPGIGRKNAEPFFMQEIPLDQKEAFLASHSEYDLVGEDVRKDRAWLVLVKNPSALRLEGGVYFVSATMLQGVCYEPWGSWCAPYEEHYRKLSGEVKPLLEDDDSARISLLGTRRPEEWREILDAFERFRFARLAAFLRSRTPDDNLNGSILVYHLSSADIKQALDGRPLFSPAEVSGR